LKELTLSRPSRFVVWMGWLSFGAGLLITVLLFLRHGGSSVPKARWRSRWGQPRWVTARDPQQLFLIDYPSNWDLSMPFERFTKHRVGEYFAMDTMAIRRGKPNGMLVIIRYVASGPKSPDAWFKETRPRGALADFFGARLLERKRGRFAGVEGLHVIAEDRITDQDYRLESWFLPAGDMAYRVTGAAPLKELAEVEPVLQRMLASFRFIDDKKGPERPLRSSIWNGPASPAAAPMSRSSATRALSVSATRSMSPGPRLSMRPARSSGPAMRTSRPARS
jgi:hypothetical protein